METKLYIKEEPLDYINDNGAETQKMLLNRIAAGYAPVKTEFDDDILTNGFEIVDEQQDVITLNAADLVSDDERNFIANLHQNATFLNKLQNESAEYDESCAHCHRKFNKPIEYDAHLKQGGCSGVVRTQRCPVCPLIFETEADRDAHIELHRLNRFFCTQYCGRCFDTVELCEKHEYFEHELSKLSCGICNCRFRSFDALTKHQVHAHINVQRYVCSYCRLWFTTSGLLAAHWRAKVNSCGLLMQNVVPHTYTDKAIVGQYKLKSVMVPTKRLSAPLEASLILGTAAKRVKQEMEAANDAIKVKEEPIDDYEQLMDSFQNTPMEPQLDIKVEEVEIKTEPIACTMPETILTQTIPTNKTSPSGGIRIKGRGNFVNIKLMPSNTFKMMPMKVVKLPPNAKIVPLPLKSAAAMLNQPLASDTEKPIPLCELERKLGMRNIMLNRLQISPMAVTATPTVSLTPTCTIKPIALNKLQSLTAISASANPNSFTQITPTVTTASTSPKTEHVEPSDLSFILDSLPDEENLLEATRRKILLSKNVIKRIEIIPEKQTLINNIREKVVKAQNGEISLDAQLAELSYAVNSQDVSKFATNLVASTALDSTSLDSMSIASRSLSPLTLPSTSLSSTPTVLPLDEKPALANNEPGQEPETMFLNLTDGVDAHLMWVRRSYPNYRFYWLCPHCTRQYELKYTFRKHLLRVHKVSLPESENMLCEVQPQKSDKCPSRRQWTRTIAKPPPDMHTFKTQPLLPSTTKFTCKRCGRNCSSLTMLCDHMRGNCSREPLYQCKICHKKFYSAGTLNCHSTIHTGELPFNCNYCSKRFRTRGQVTVHHRTHTGERPFVCEVCQQGFTHRETLISHLSRHIGMKRYKCYGCDLHFSCISGLRTHRDIRPDTCGKVKLNTRAVGPRVRVIRGNVLFEPQPEINPYLRTEDPQDILSEIQNQQNSLTAMPVEEK